MRFFWNFGVLLSSALFTMTLLAAPAHAQATRTWVSGVGDDANPCDRTAPCKTFAGAISKTAPGGEIDVLDPGGFGALTITKSITIDGGGGLVASVLVSGTNGINVAAGSNDVVVLRNLRFQGLNGSGITGISFSGGRMLVVDNCTIDGFSVAGISASTSSTVKFFVTNITITNAATGISLSPTGNLSGQIDHTSIRDMSTAGISTSGPSNVTVSNSVVSNTSTGVIASGSVLGIDSSQINNNGTAFSTAGGFMRVSRNVVYDNNTNFSISGGTIASAGNNMVAVNGATVPNGTVAQQ